MFGYVFMAKFKKVILNGKQTLTSSGWSTLKDAISRMSKIPNSIKLQSLELKVEKRKKDVIKDGTKYAHKMGGKRPSSIFALDNDECLGIFWF